MAKGSDRIWQNDEVVRNFLNDTRGALPLAGYQIETMLRLIATGRPSIHTFLDLGCGDGILGRSIRARYPEADGVFLDFSEPMLTNARQKLNGTPNVTFIQQDFGQPGWQESITTWKPFDVIVSGFAIHHQPDTRKRAIYQEIYDLLPPGGIFLNLEHVKPATEWVEHITEELVIDGLYDYHRSRQPDLSREAVAQNFHARADKAANILAPVENQCQWLREIGFTHVDCYLKVFEFALFGGLRP